MFESVSLCSYPVLNPGSDVIKTKSNIAKTQEKTSSRSSSSLWSKRISHTKFSKSRQKKKSKESKTIIKIHDRDPRFTPLKSTINPSISCLIFFFLVFCLIKKKIKNEPITDCHVSLRPMKQWKTRRLIRRFWHLFFLSYGGAHHLALH